MRVFFFSSCFVFVFVFAFFRLEFIFIRSAAGKGCGARKEGRKDFLEVLFSR